MITTIAGGVELALQIQPRAPRSEVVGPHGGAVKIRLAAPPVDGEANEELVRFLAKALGVPKGAIEIVGGMTGRKKRVRVRGVVAEMVTQKLKVEG